MLLTYIFKGIWEDHKDQPSLRFYIILWMLDLGVLSGVRILIRGMIYFCTITHSFDVKIFINEMKIHQQNDSIENKLCIMPHKVMTVEGVKDLA